MSNFDFDSLADRPAPELFDLTGRVALVTGAAGRLGRAMAFVLAEAGATVLLNGRNEERLKDLQNDIEGIGAKAERACFDVTDDQAVLDCFEEISKRHGRLDVLINNAYTGVTGGFDVSTPDSFSAAADVIVSGALRCLKAAENIMRVAVKSKGHASVINVASMYGLVSPRHKVYPSIKEANSPAYGAAKAALIQFTRYAACNWAEVGIRVNAISPGPFPPPDIAESKPEFYKALVERTPMGRIGVPDEIKGVVLFLASDASSYVTGTNISIDGGWTAW